MMPVEMTLIAVPPLVAFIAVILGLLYWDRSRLIVHAASIAARFWVGATWLAPLPILAVVAGASWGMAFGAYYLLALVAGQLLGRGTSKARVVRARGQVDARTGAQL